MLALFLRICQEDGRNVNHLFFKIFERPGRIHKRQEIFRGSARTPAARHDPRCHRPAVEYVAGLAADPTAPFYASTSNRRPPDRRCRHAHRFLIERPRADAGGRHAGAGRGQQPFPLPADGRVDQVDDYHGTKVADPYRWLEDANSPQTQAWVEAQNNVTFAYLRHLPAREGIKQRLTQLWDYEKYGVPFKEGGRYFYTKNTGLQNQSVIYTAPVARRQTDRAARSEQTLGDGTVSLSSYHVSDDGHYMAYGLNTSGSDWIEWHVRDVTTGQDLPDVLKWSKFSGAEWTKDNKGFFYSRYDAPDEKTHSRRSTIIRNSTITPSARRRTRTRWSTSARTRRNGASGRCHRRRPVSHHRREPRHRPEEPGLLPFAERRRRRAWLTATGRAG